MQVSDGIKYNGEHRLNVEEKKPRDGMRGRGGMSRGGMGGQGMGRGSYGSGSGRGNMKNGGGFGRQDVRNSSNLAPRGGMQGRR